MHSMLNEQLFAFFVLLCFVLLVTIVLKDKKFCKDKSFAVGITVSINTFTQQG